MSAIIWLTGVVSSGKTTVAKELQLQSRMNDYPCILLDVDEIRKSLWPKLGLSDKNRSENVQRIGRLAVMLAKQFYGPRALIIVACIAPYQKDRDINRQLAEDNHCKYYEVHVRSSLSSRIARDPKGLYKRAAEGKISNLTGYNGVYEEPIRPLIIIDTDIKSPGELASEILKRLVDC